MMDVKEGYRRRIEAIISGLKADLKTLPAGAEQQRIGFDLERMEQIVACCFEDEKVSELSQHRVPFGAGCCDLSLPE